MNREQAKALLPIITAFAEGKTIQCRGHTVGCREWKDVDNPSFGYTPDMYRIKPEPMECWVNVYEDGTLGKSWPTEREAKRSAAPSLSGVRTVLLREVLE